MRPQRGGGAAHLRSAVMNSGDLATAHSANWDFISSMVRSSLTGSPIYKPPSSSISQALPGTSGAACMLLEHR
jgi:hypothetical protein